MMQPQQTALYVADMILALRNLAKGQNFKTLQGLLEISYYEAYGIAHQVDVPADESIRLEELGSDARRSQVA